MPQVQMPGLTQCAVDAAVVAGTTSTITTGVGTHFCINGKAFLRASASNSASPTTDTAGDVFETLQPDQGCALVIGLNAAGALVMEQGEISEMDGDTDEFLFAPQFPSTPDTMCPIAYVILSLAGNASAFTPGTSTWGGTGVTNTFVSVMTLPDTPQTD